MIIGCTYGYQHLQFKYSDAIANENKYSVISFVQIGETTNIDILKKYKKPFTKFIFNDGRYSYNYYMLNEKPKYKGIFSNINIIEKDSKYISFTFNSEGKLTKFSYSEDGLDDINKYDMVSVELDENIDIRNMLSIFNDIKIGSKKGHVFRKMGKPMTTRTEDEIEIWEYMPLYNKKISGIEDEKVLPVSWLCLEFSGDILKNKYTYQISLLSDEENIILQEEK